MLHGIFCMTFKILNFLVIDKFRFLTDGVTYVVITFFITHSETKKMQFHDPEIHTKRMIYNSACSFFC